MHCSARSTGSAKIIHYVNLKKHYFFHWHCPTKMDKCPTLFVLGREFVLHASKIIIYIYIYIKLLLTEREVCTEKHRTEVFFLQTEPVRRGLYKKTEVRYFSVHTEQARLIKSLLYGIYMNLKKCTIGNAY